MNLLIVDDEIYVVRALKKNIEASELGFDQVFIAFNAAKAREILQSETVDVMVTDIQMPMESGLELLRWAREQGKDCVAILLTSYAEFAYAQEAMRLGVMDYVMKPINFDELRENLKKAQALALEQRTRKEHREKARAWEQEKYELESGFWRDVILPGRFSSQAEIAAEAERRNLRYDITDQYLPVLCAVKGFGDREQEWRESPERMRDIVQNIAMDIFLNEEDRGKLGWSERRMWIVTPESRLEGFRESLETFVKVCRDLTGVRTVLYYGSLCYAEELAAAFSQLLERDSKNVAMQSGVLGQDAEERPYQWDEALGREIYDCFAEGNFELIEKNIGRFSETAAGQVDEKSLILMVDITKAGIISYLAKNGKTGYDFWTDALILRSREIYRSAQKAAAFALDAVRRLREIAEAPAGEEQTMQQVRDFVAAHLEDGIDRDRVAAHMGYSADYLSKLFKKKAGKSLGEYIIDQKVNRARQLLGGSDYTVGEISSRLGYSSFSYFSEVFRKKTGLLPTDYRKNERRRTEK